MPHTLTQRYPTKFDCDKWRKRRTFLIHTHDIELFMYMHSEQLYMYVHANIHPPYPPYKVHYKSHRSVDKILILNKDNICKIFNVHK